MLGALTLANRGQPTGQVSYPDSAACLLHMLPARPARPESLHLQIPRIYVQSHLFLCFRKNLHQHKRGMPGMVSIKGRKSHQSVNPMLTLEIAVSVVSFNSQDSTFNACFIAMGNIQCLSVVIMPFRPPQIHSEQHTCPILRFRAASTSVNGKYGIVGIVLAAQNQLTFHLLKLRSYFLHPHVYLFT